jgi:alpha-amylase/alpha-mannosidase (GH57 family)
MKRFLCIHGHFYQPPRENAWLEAIELQDSAYPYHDWNERITAECYAPNADSRMLDARDRIQQIVNNYANISFNFGPTLLAWMETFAKPTYERIIQADAMSAERFGGHGSAMAQSFHHSILPLSNDRDRRTEVLWGVRDFRHRYGRDPEGMWLPETAVDLATLDEFAAAGIRYTVLAPHQASEVRRIGGTEWEDVSGARVDPTQPYLCRLPSGREIALFFYDGPVSRAVAFEGLLRNGERFARRVLGVLRDSPGPQLAHIATDGETYGHHHRHGDMALAYALHHVQKEQLARLTNYGEFLSLHPPTFEVRIFEDTSWSCAHGIERWRSDCGCHTGGDPGWHQRWRAPLRESLDWLRDRLGPAYERLASLHLKDPWAARDAYVDVLLDRSPASLDSFIAAHAIKPAAEADRVTILKLLELQRHALLMYTSCGWFFNELSGIETVQVMQYAGRALQLGEELFGESFEDEFLRRLDLAESNVASLASRGRTYEQKVKPAMVDLMHVVAHYAVSSIFDTFEGQEDVYCYTVELESHTLREGGESRLSVGRARVTSRITTESDVATFALLHFGGHNMSGGVRRFVGDEEYRQLTKQLRDAFDKGDFALLIQLLAHFPEYTFSLRSLFADRQREILYRTLEPSLRLAEQAYRRLYDDNIGVIRYLIDLGLPLPRAFAMAAEYVLNRELRAAFAEPPIDIERARTLLDEANAAQVTLDRSGLSYALELSLERLAAAVRDTPRDAANLERLAEVAAFARALPFPVDLWKVQNIFYDIVQRQYPIIAAEADSTNGDAELWIRLARTVGEQLGVAVS